MKTKKVLLNLITDIFPMLVISLIGIFKFKLFVQVLGVETQGMYQTFNQIMFYISIVDGGLGSAVLYALYKPITADHTEAVNEILSGAMLLFSKIGLFVYGIAFVFSFFVPFMIKDNPFEYSFVVLTFLLFALGSVIGYFFVPHQSLLEAKECRYVYNAVFQLGQIIQGILEIIFLLIGFRLIAILLMMAVVKLASYVILAVYSHKKFPEYHYNSKKKNMAFSKQVKHLMFHKINGLVGSNIDVIIITTMLGLRETGIYSAYSYIITMIKQIVEKIYSSVLAILGNLLSSDTQKAFCLFKELNSLLFFISNVLCVPLILSIDDFIRIWYEGEIPTDHMVAIAFVGLLLLAIIKIDTTVFVNAGGLFRETKVCALVDTVVNFVLSLSLVFVFGMSGVLIATCISVFIAEYVMKTLVIHKYIFKTSSLWFFIKNIKFFALMGADWVVGFWITQNLRFENLFFWFLFYTVFTAINSVLILLIYHLMKEDEFMKRVKFSKFKREARNAE